MRTFAVAVALALATAIGGVASAATPGPARLSASSCVRAWNAVPRAPAITALRGTHLARIRVFNRKTALSGCIVSILRPGPKGIMVIGTRRGTNAIGWRAPMAAEGMTRADVRVNAMVGPGGVLALR